MEQHETMDVYVVVSVSISELLRVLMPVYSFPVVVQIYICI